MTPNDLIAAFEVLADAPDGVKRLRELVLSLAVRGKLVAQDPEDEPAGTLIRKIEAQFPHPPKGKPAHTGGRPIDSGEVERHPGWAYAPLGSIAQVVRGITFPASAKNRQPGDGLVPCLRTTNVQSRITWEDLLYVSTEYVSRVDQYLRVDDIVMSMANSRELVGKVALNDRDAAGVTFGGFLAVIRPILVVPRFLLVVLQTTKARESLIDSATQTTNIANISLGRLNPFVVPIPPLAEQHRIVARVDELMGLLDRLEAARATRDAVRRAARDAALADLRDAPDAEAVEAAWGRIARQMDDLFTDPEDVGPLRQAVLQLAVRGRLVPQDPKDEPASVLLELIAAHKARLVKEKKLGKPESLQPVATDEVPFEVPKGWVWARVEHLVEQVTDGVHQTPTYVSTGVPFLSIKDISAGVLDFSNTRFVTREAHEEMCRRCKPERGDILFCRIGTLGRALVIDSDVEFSIFVSLGLLKMTGFLNSQFMQTVLNSPASYDQYQRIKTGGSHTDKLNLGTMRSAIMPIAPLAEQHRIVAKVDALTALCDALEARLTAARDLHGQFAAAAVHHLDA